MIVQHPSDLRASHGAAGLHTDVPTQNSQQLLVLATKSGLTGEVPTQACSQMNLRSR